MKDRSVIAVAATKTLSVIVTPGALAAGGNAPVDSYCIGIGEKHRYY